MTFREGLLVSSVLAIAAIAGLVGRALPAELAAESALAGPTTGVTLGFVAFAIAVAIGELLPLPKPNGGSVPLSVAVLAAYAVLVPRPVDAAAMAFVGSAGAYLLARVRHEDRPTPSDVVAAVAGGWMAAGLAASGASLMASLDLGLPGWLALSPRFGAMLFVSLAVIAGTPLWDAVVRPDPDPLGLRYVHRFRGGWMAGAALASAALLGVLVHEPLGLTALPLVLLPLLAARAGLRRYATVRDTHDQTVRAFSRLPEELGTVPPGHGIRVADVVVTAARDLGLPPEMVPALERAAHLHELGRIRGEPGELIDPEVVALDGASILREAGLDEVADIVGLHRVPELPTGTLETAARLVRLACDADRAIEEHGEDGLPAVARVIADGEDLRVLGSITKALTAQPTA